MSKPQLDLLSRLWEEHMRAQFRPRLRGREINGEDLVLLDAGIAGCVSSSLSGPLDEKRRRTLLGCLAAVEKVLPSLGDGGDAVEYYERLRAMAGLAAELRTAMTR
ncbi:hypothetical protein ACIRP2_38770 [Streptomyces sp. NPDC101194]|uniref:hypothetical protein n=1 Tax=Streptomyces sp. NPDC101194 TaxID=3366127 RepID=UPI0037F47120